MLPRQWVGLGFLAVLGSAGCGPGGPNASSPTVSAITRLRVDQQSTPQFNTLPNTPATLSQIQFVSDRVGFAMGSLGQVAAVLQTTNGGRTWQPRHLFPSLLGLTMINAQTGWMTACPQTGCQLATSLARTTDGGRSWTTIFDAPANTSLSPPDFVSATTGWMVESNSQTAQSRLYRTTDGGSTWMPTGAVPLFPGALGSSVDFLNATTGWLLAGSEPGAGEQMKALYQTTNGGQFWTEIAQSAPLGASSAAGSLSVGGYVDVLHFVNSQLGYMALARGAVYRTTDGGLHWNVVWANHFPPDSVMVDSLAFPAAHTGFILTEGGGSILWATTDGGRHWSRRYPPATPTGSVSFATPGLGMGMGGSSSSILITQNGGQTWREAVGPAINIAALQWGEGHTIWVVGQNGAVYMSSDLGHHFQAISVPGRQRAQSLSMTASGRGVMVTDSPQGTRAWVSNHGGQHWQRLALPFAPRLLTSPAPDDLWAIGMSSTAVGAQHAFDEHHAHDPAAIKRYEAGHPLTPYLYHTVNGQTWLRYQLPSAQRANNGYPLGLNFLNRQFGYLWYQRTIFITQDGGKSWHTETVPPNITIQWVNFVSPTEGWLTPGGQAPLYHTTNGGRTWSS
ncbi:MAG: YCF48-related protein [Thermaerobacter sp.]|nr:YCF48-related protein [Thermaerobacter sp.]